VSVAAAGTDIGDLPVVVVLGAGMGGRGVCTALTGAARLVVVDRTIEIAARAVTPVLANGGVAEPVGIDLTDIDAVSTFRDDLMSMYGRVDAVVHLVGGWQGSTTVDAGAIKAWSALLPGVLTTVQTTTVAFADTLAAAPRGRYVMVSSVSVAAPTQGNAAYASLKAAAQTWVAALDNAFVSNESGAARAVTVAVKALVDDAMRQANPDKKFPGYTDVAELGRVIADVLGDADLPSSPAYLDLTAD
jgi:NADP-dependent 3-hydroxy acid dehydrogenase YdfG